MLILTRRVGERVIIGENIIINVLNIHRGQVKIGIDAPREISVHREEVLIRIAEGGATATATAPTTVEE